MRPISRPARLARLRRLGPALVAVTLGASVLPVGLTAAQAAVVTPGAVVINEVYGGGGNSGATYTHDFVELRNTGTEPVSLDGWTLQYASKTGTFNNSLALSGTIAPGDTFLIQLAQGAGGTTPLPGADLTGTINAAGTGGVFALSDASGKLACTGTTCATDPAVVDLVGWGGASTYSGDAPAPATTNATSVARTASTGENSTDFTVGEPTPQPSGTAVEEPTPTDPTPTDPTPTDPAPAPQVVSISEIQGTGAASPLVGQTVTTEGVVTAVYAEGGLNGYVIQTGGTGGALDFSSHQGSTAVFVYSPQTVSQVAIGDSVRVTGQVSEYFGSTQITVQDGGLTRLDAPLEAVQPLSLDLFPTEEAQRESIEHMLYLPGEGDFTVTDVYPTNQYGEVGLAIGDQPLRQPGDVMIPGAEATAAYEALAAQKVLLDDGRTTNFSRNPQQPMSWLTTEEPVVVGASTTFTQPVIVSYGFDAWRLQPTSPWTSAATDGVTFGDAREETPENVGGDLQLATFNVLNYFTTLGENTPGCTPYTNMDGDGTNVRGGCDLRGAWGADDLERQQTKIVEAISTSGAEVVGLMEIENSARLGETPDEATATLVAALNARDGEGTWAYVPTADAYAAQGRDGGQDVITNAIIYRTAAVTPVGGAQILAGDPAFDNAREPIGQVFAPVNAEGEQGDPFLFVLNHFKSKGSQDAEDAGLTPDPVQGNARTSRMQQAKALSAWVAERQAALGVQDVFLAGDFNAYSQELPLQHLYEQGYVNLGATYDPEGFSYTFGGMVGSLDHVIANASAAERVTGADHWHINGGESPMTQYSRYRNNVTDLYEPTVFGSSDHSPLVVGLDGEFPAPQPTDPEPTDPEPTDPTPTDPTPEQPGKPGKPENPGRGLGRDKGAGHPGRGADHASEQGLTHGKGLQRR
ncbi:ExeM/NucH family extracellular endonuclease [Brachybacterium sp. EF45031]|uniref:ExeM/NucH family extracellular endonuclease n=1 Tax=Brachybacterium sillae TaxID=2810536 RepID=UPI002559AD9B|nr:ExeM/NucH family extracellular endonuclease [Brachybacterium sillae]MCS6711479.1 ExeM/NucH family extracellular endonuclease [Brachybacterium sillae]